jgi:uncharacterized sodium:solute symporter family permease YidK
VKAVLKGLHRELIQCISIIIGTVPVWQSACPQQALPTPTAPPPMPVAAYMRKLIHMYHLYLCPNQFIIQNTVAKWGRKEGNASETLLYLYPYGLMIQVTAEKKRRKLGQLPWLC